MLPGGWKGRSIAGWAGDGKQGPEGVGDEPDRTLGAQAGPGGATRKDGAAATMPPGKAQASVLPMQVPAGLPPPPAPAASRRQIHTPSPAQSKKCRGRDIFCQDPANRMRPKTELFLYQMLWGADKLLQPTLRNLFESFEGWAYRNGLLWQIRRLEAAGYLEASEETFDGKRMHRLTEAGRLAALGGRDPERAWGSEWDRKWRLFLYDVPEREKSARRQLTRTLTGLGCGCLQRSVWIAATVPAGIEKALAEQGDDCSHLMFFEAESRGRRVDRRMVDAAWDFDGINDNYERHMEILKRLPGEEERVTAEFLAQWAREENAAWMAAVRADPLLPGCLLPKGYAGRRAWRQRTGVLARAGGLAAKAMDPDAAAGEA